MKHVVLAAALAAASLTAAPALAQSSDTKEDLRCVLVTNSVLADQQEKKDYKPGDDAPGIMMAGYFLGRADAREPKIDMTKALQQAADDIDRMKDADYEKLFDRCFNRFEAKSKAMSAWSAAEEAREAREALEAKKP